MQRDPVKRRAKLSRQRALAVITIPTQVAQRHGATQGQDGRKQNGKELLLGLTQPGHLPEDGGDNCHGDG